MKSEFFDVVAKGESARALLCMIENEEFWVPKSVIHDDSEVYRQGDAGTLALQEWWAEKMQPRMVHSTRTDERSVMGTSIKLTTEQRGIADRAIVVVRKDLGGRGLRGISEGRCMELVCADYQGGITMQIRWIEDVRWQLKLYQHKGFGLTTSSGCLGTSIIDPRKDMFRVVRLLVGAWGIELHVSWKE